MTDKSVKFFKVLIAVTNIALFLALQYYVVGPHLQIR